MRQKKKWMIPLCVIGGLLLICAGLLWYMASHSMGFSVGRCLVADNGSYMFIDGNSPIVMSTRRDKKRMFAGLETGDKILLLHDGIQETYPGGTGAYWCMKLEDGTQADIPEQVMEELAELGWTIVANEANPNAGAPAPEAYAFDAQYIRTDGYSEERAYPYHTVISSKAELEAYYEAYKDIYDLERREVVYSDTSIGFLDACDKYDDAYFERQNLVLIVLQEGSGSIRHEITDVRRRWDENGASLGWNITIKSTAPEVVTDDMAEWHLFLEVQMGNVIKDGDAVWINDKLSRNGSENKDAEPSVVKTYEKTPSEHAFENDELCVLVKHYEMSDGTWKTDGHTYQYRLEITGRMNNAAKDSTFVYLSNVEDISFDKAWKASGFSSNRNDYFDSEVATLVAMK